MRPSAIRAPHDGSAERHVPLPIAHAWVPVAFKVSGASCKDECRQHCGDRRCASHRLTPTRTSTRGCKDLGPCGRPLPRLPRGAHRRTNLCMSLARVPGVAHGVGRLWMDVLLARIRVVGCDPVALGGASPMRRQHAPATRAEWGRWRRRRDSSLGAEPPLCTGWVRAAELAHSRFCQPRGTPHRRGSRRCSRSEAVGVEGSGLCRGASNVGRRGSH